MLERLRGAGCAARCAGFRPAAGVVEPALERWEAAIAELTARRDPGARERFAAARVAHLATADASARPHLVPIVFALVGDTIYSAVDESQAHDRSCAGSRTSLRTLRSPSSPTTTRRLAKLWWVRADGPARVLEAGRRGRARVDAARRALSPAAAPPGAVLAIDVARWSGWSSG